MKDLFYEKPNETDSIVFDDNGVLYGSVYSYEIDSYGEFELNKEQTKELYLAMKKYYGG